MLKTSIILCCLPVLPLLLPAQINHAELEQRITEKMENALVAEGKRPVHNFLLYAKNENTGFEMNKAVGTRGRDDTPIDASFQYNIASITKPFVATIILQLAEENKLALHDPIAKYLGGVEFVRLDELHILDGEKYHDSITVKMLLNHTSGIADVFSDAGTRFNISVFLHPKRQYTPQKFYKRYFRYNLNKKPKNIPGKGYDYSDINYMLLGFIIEKITGNGLHEAIRSRILEPLSMQETYFEYYEPPRGSGQKIDAFLNKINITKRINTSYEWAGGGLVSTVKDMAIFIEGLLAGQLFKHDETLQKMTDTSTTEALGAHYGLGLFAYELDGKRFYGHGGFYGSILVHSPEHEITLSANIGQSNAPYSTSQLVNDIIKMLSE